MKKLAYKILSVIGGLIFLFFLSTNPAYATTVDEVINKVNTEYTAGHITDIDVRDELLNLLDDAKLVSSEADIEEYNALIESFRITVSAHSGDTISTTSANSILTLASGL